jgi:hypothetical protein
MNVLIHIKLFFHKETFTKETIRGQTPLINPPNHNKLGANPIRGQALLVNQTFLEGKFNQRKRSIVYSDFGVSILYSNLIAGIQS